MHTSSQPRYSLNLGGEVHELRPGMYRLHLCDIVSLLVLDKQATRASYQMVGDEKDLDPLSASLFRHLKQQRCAGPNYTDVGGKTQSFRLHSVVDALVAAHFFFSAWDHAPHFFVGTADHDFLACLDGGIKTHLTVDDPPLLERVRASLADLG